MLKLLWRNSLFLALILTVKAIANQQQNSVEEKENNACTKRNISKNNQRKESNKTSLLIFLYDEDLDNKP